MRGSYPASSYRRIEVVFRVSDVSWYGPCLIMRRSSSFETQISNIESGVGLKIECNRKTD
jgi:hypothetical protein